MTDGSSHTERSVSPLDAVWRLEVATVPWPLADRLACTTKHVIGGAGLTTVTGIGTDVAERPSPSDSAAAMVWEPSAVPVVFHCMA